MEPVTHVLFDFFGTLVHYSESRVEQDHAGSYRLLRNEGFSASYADFLTSWSATFDSFEAQALRSLEEFSMTEVCNAYLTAALQRVPSAALVAQFIETYLAEWNQGVRYIPGVRQLLEQLAQDYRLVLVSNTHHADLVVQHLERMEVRHLFQAVVTSVAHRRRKPSACIFQHALGKTGGHARYAVYVGDSYAADYVGATEAGLRCLLIDPLKAHAIPETARLSTILEVTSALRG
jgi:putative hydrolase of the HAD superfamily